MVYEEMLKLTETLLRLKYILWGCILKSVRFIVYKGKKIRRLDQSYLYGYVCIYHTPITILITRKFSTRQCFDT